MASDKSKNGKSKAAKSSKQIIDVSHPGDTTPDDTSVPIITSRPIMKDPMVLGQESVNEMEDEKVDLKIPTREAKKIEMKDTDTVAEIAVKAKAEKEQEEIEQAEIEAKAKAAEGDVESGGATGDIPMVTGGEKVIQPLAQSEKPKDEKDESEDEAKKSDDKDSDDEESKDEDKDKSKSENSGDNKSPEKNDLDELAKEEAKKAEHDANVQKIIDSKTYELPITTEETRRSTRMTLLGVLLAIILGVAWIDVALDAGLIQLAGVPHTTYFSQSTSTTSQTALPPKAKFQTIDAQTAKVSFKVPGAWKVDSVSSADKDAMLILIKQSDAGPTYDHISASFISPPTTSTTTKTTSVKVLYVKYTKLPRQIYQTTYLRELIYKTNAETIYGTTGLTNDNSIKVDSSITEPRPMFLNPGGQSSSAFNLNLTAARDGKPGFGTLNSAKQFLSSNTYLQAKAMLLSTTATEQ